MKAVILVGGLGTRLRSLIADRPKPMADVAGRPFLEYLIQLLKVQGICEFVFCAGYRAYEMRDHFKDGADLGVHIDYAIEPELLGTAGALQNARSYIQDRFLLLNGDTYAQIDVQALLASHDNRRIADPATICTLAAVWMGDTAASGRLDVAADGRVAGFSEKGVSQPGFINAGIYVIEPDILDSIPAGRPVSLEKETFPLLLKRGCHLYYFPTPEFFVDIGTPEGYQRFRSFILQRDS